MCMSFFRVFSIWFLTMMCYRRFWDKLDFRIHVYVPCVQGICIEYWKTLEITVIVPLQMDFNCMLSYGLLLGNQMFCVTCLYILDSDLSEFYLRLVSPSLWLFFTLCDVLVNRHYKFQCSWIYDIFYYFYRPLPILILKIFFLI